MMVAGVHNMQFYKFEGITTDEKWSEGNDNRRVMYEKILPNLDCCCIPPIKAVEKTNDNFPFSS